MQDIVRTYFSGEGKREMESALADGWKVVSCHDITDGLRHCLEYIIEKPDDMDNELPWNQHEEEKEWHETEDCTPYDAKDYLLRNSNGNLYVGRYDSTHNYFVVDNPGSYGCTIMGSIVEWREI